MPINYNITTSGSSNWTCYGTTASTNNNVEIDWDFVTYDQLMIKNCYFKVANDPPVKDKQYIFEFMREEYILQYV